MILTKEQFRESFYYPAAGCDLNPLLRFSDLTDTFVYTNLGLSEKEVIRYINQELYRYKGQLEIKDEGKSFSMDEIEYHEDTSEICFAFINKIDEKDFHNVFEEKIKEPFWGREFIFNRITGGRRKTLRLIYLKDEGMTAYIGLSQRGNYVPRYLCTIQSGHLETPEGPMERIMECYDNYPDIWIRGFQYKKSYFGNLSFRFLYASEAFRNTGSYNQKVQTFGKWYANPTWQSKDVYNFKRHVAAFCREENIPKTKEEVIIKTEGRTMAIKRKRVEKKDFKSYDAVFTSKNLLKKTAASGENFVMWDELYSEESHNYPDMSVILNFVDYVCEEKKYSKILLTLTGYEDSGENIIDWFMNKTKIENIEIRTINLFDLYSIMKI